MSRRDRKEWEKRGGEKGRGRGGTEGERGEEKKTYQSHAFDYLFVNFQEVEIHGLTFDLLADLHKYN